MNDLETACQQAGHAIQLARAAGRRESFQGFWFLGRGANYEKS